MSAASITTPAATTTTIPTSARLGMMLTDTTGTTWASAFNEMGEKMLGRSANDLAEMKKIGDETGCAQHTRAAAWFRCAPACQLACLWPVTGGSCARRVG